MNDVPPPPQTFNTTPPNMTPNAPSLNAPAVVVGVAGGVVLTPDGETVALDNTPLSVRISDYGVSGQAVLVCHAPTVAHRLGLSHLMALDVLELWAFVRPATFCVPTVAGICRELGLPAPDSPTDSAIKLTQIAGVLLRELSDMPRTMGVGDFRALCRMVAGLHRVNWAWAKPVMGALGINPSDYKNDTLGSGLDVWNRLPEWQEPAPDGDGGGHTVSEQESTDRLQSILGSGAEIRQGQMDYARSLATVFQGATPVGGDGHHGNNGGSGEETAFAPPLVLAEAGTGVGKTLGYIAPSSVWVDKNQSPVWMSTYTRNLQHQIEGELSRLYPDPTEKRKRVVVRKGRENYLCVGRFEWAVRRLAIKPDTMVALSLLARWIMHTKDGDLNGGDFPSWLNDIIDPKRHVLYNLVVRYDDGGSHSDCNHGKVCFVDLVAKRAGCADIVVVNHALVLSQARMGAFGAENGAENGTETPVGENLTPDDTPPIPPVIFDEGHHLFSATDSAFTTAMTARAGERLRAFVAPRETDLFNDSPDSNLKQMVGDAIADDADAVGALDNLVRGMDFLVSDNWYKRLHKGDPKGSMEWFLVHVGKRVYGLDNHRNMPYSLECGVADCPPELLQAGQALLTDLMAVRDPAQILSRALASKLTAGADTLDTHQKRALRLAVGQLQSRVVNPIVAWTAMVADVVNSTPPDDVVDRFIVQRHQGRDTDLGMVRSLVDPMPCFAHGVVAQSQGVAITSATLTKGQGGTEGADYGDDQWQWATARTGASHHPTPAKRVRVPSPFDYPKQTRVYIITDVDHSNGAEVASAFRALFCASHGGALGLFTAISRLQTVYDSIAPLLAQVDIPLYAQHVDRLSLPTLIDMFRAERHSCLLGTDAVRDGVDVPGDSLRMIVFEKTPYPRPDILHKARRKHFGKGYDDALTTASLKQAFGRLIRRQDDRGVFIMLDKCPSRYHDAFPDGVEIIKQGLAQTVQDVGEFLG